MFNTLDYIILASFLLLIVWTAYSTNKLTKSVAGFLSSERCAGRYLLTLSQAMAFISAVSFISGFQMFYKSGFSAYWWGLMGMPVSIILAMSGWVTYRYRSTRALTMPQFLEIRYSRKLRIFSGFLAFLAGILNCGIFPAVTTRFIMAFTGMPSHAEVLGINVALFPVILFSIVIFPIILALSGGQVSIMVTDFFQGIITNVAILAIVFFMLSKFDTAMVFDTLKTAPADQSHLNPFKQGELPDFGPSFFFMMIFLRVFSQGVWQGNSGYLSSAKNAHEGRMATMLGEWRNSINTILLIVPIIFWAIMHNAQFTEFATQISEQMLNFGTAHEQSETLVPIGLKLILPSGLLGFVLIMILGASISTDDSAYHSWGSIFLQDAIMPFRKKPFTQKKHMLYLRLSILGIGAFAYTFSLLFPLREYLAMWTTITSAIFVGGCGCVVIGGLYWSRGTTIGAWSSLIFGSVVSGGSIILRQIWANNEALNRIMAYEDLPNGMVVSFYAMLSSSLIYFIVSLLTCKEKYNMDKLLHRGVYAVPDDRPEEEKKKDKKIALIPRLLGFTKEFSTVDKVIYICQYLWMGFWIAVFIFGTAYNIKHEVSDDTWIAWWKIYICIYISMATLITLWYGIGGAKNIVELYSTLRNKKTDESDDGTV